MVWVKLRARPGWESNGVRSVCPGPGRRCISNIEHPIQCFCALRCTVEHTCLLEPKIHRPRNTSKHVFFAATVFCSYDSFLLLTIVLMFSDKSFSFSFRRGLNRTLGLTRVVLQNWGIGRIRSLYFLRSCNFQQQQTTVEIREG